MVVMMMTMVMLMVVLVVAIVMAAIFNAWLMRTHGVAQFANCLGYLLGVSFIGLITHGNRAMLN